MKCEDICYKHCFCYLSVENLKQIDSVLAANGSLVGILITIGDVTDIFAVGVGVSTALLAHPNSLWCELWHFMRGVNGTDSRILKTQWIVDHL